MKLIIGLGNPGKQYTNTRHNIGFMAVDHLAKNYQVDFKVNNQLDGALAEINHLGKKTIILKPLTYMNLSGVSVLKVMNYFKIEIENIIVVVDDIDLEPGRIRMREMGGHGGHNGLRDIIKHLKTRQFKRLRIGIGNNPKAPLDSYVLGVFSKSEQMQIANALDLTVNALVSFVEEVPYLDIMTSINTQSK